MQIGLIGLGKMGYNLALNLKNKNHEVIAFDINKVAMAKIAARGVKTAPTICDLLNALNGRRIIWIMVPAGNTVDVIISNLKNHLKKNDIVIDGGNSHFKDTITRARDLRRRGVHFLDCGTSGGAEGALHGISAMVGGKKEIFDYCEPVFKSISVPDGYLHCGETGSGHFTKMAHSGIQYGMMQSVTQGIEVLHNYCDETRFAKAAHIWSQGSVMRSWLN